MSLKAPSRSASFVCSSCRKALSRTITRNHTTTTTSKPDIYDVVTVGGGPVGLALLAALKSSPKTSHLRCALIEAQDLSRSRNWSMPPDQFSNRASSITPTNVSFLDQIGAWNQIDQSRTQPYDEMQVWDAENDDSIQFDWRAEATKYNAPPRTVATMTENANLTRALLNRISELGADDCLLSNTMVSSIQNGEDDPDGINLATWPVITTKSNSDSNSSSSSSLATRLLIGADGLNSPVRSYAGINTNGWDYQRHGVVATLKLAPPEEPNTFIDPNSLSSDQQFSNLSNRATAFQRFLPSLGGPIAILPLPNNNASLVWSTTPQVAAQLKKLSPSAFVATLNAALRLNQTDIKYILSLPPSSNSSLSDNPTQQHEHEEELTWRTQHTPRHPTITPPTITSVQQDTIASFPLRLRHTTSLTAPRVALAGDAAHTIHPLAGQGLNLGLADASSLAGTISYAIEHGMDLGDPMTLERYSAARFGPGLKMALGVDGLNWVYQLGSPTGVVGDGLVGSALGKLRGLGMRVIGGSDYVRGLIMRQAG